MKQPLAAVPQPIYPTLGSLQEVIDLADSKLPVITRNEMVSLLATYHNTLLKLIQQH